MFSKAKVKRFNEEVGCAPAPTAYDPKVLDKPLAVTLDRSDRWKENKENIPAPNAYNPVKGPPRTPSRILQPKHSKSLNCTASSNALNLSSISSCSSNSCSSSTCKKDGFLRPTSTRLTRGDSVRSSNTKIEKETLLKTLQQDKEELQKIVADLKQRLASLEQERPSVCNVSDKQAQTEDVGVAPAHAAQTEEDESKALLQSAQSQLSAAQSAVSALQDEKSGLLLQLQQLQITSPARDTRPVVATVTVDAEAEPDLVEEEMQHLKLVRDNLEESLLLKTAQIADLEERCGLLQQACSEHEAQLQRCAQLVLGCGDQTTCPEDDEVLSDTAARVSSLVRRYQALLATHDSVSEAHQHQLSALKEELQQLKDKILEYEKEVPRLLSEATVREREMNGLREKVKELDLLTKEKDLMESVLQEEIRQRNHELSLLEEAYTAMETKLSEAEARSTDVLNERAEKEAVEEKLRQATVSLREAEVVQQFLEKELLNRENEISASEQKAEELSQELGATRREALDLRQEAEAQLNQVLVLRASLAAKDYDVDERDEKIMALKEEIVTKTELVSDLQSMVSCHKTSEADLKSQLQEKVKALEDVEEKLSQAIKKCGTLEEELSQHHSESETALLCLKDMHAAEILDLNALKEEQAAKVCSLRQQCTTNEQSIAELEAKLADKTETIKSLEQKIVELMAELEDSEADHVIKLKEALSEVDDLSNQYSDSLLELDSTRRALALTSEEHERMSLTLEAAEADVIKVKADLQNAKREARDRTSECQALEDSLRRLTDKYSTFEQAKLSEEAERAELMRRLQVELELSKQSLSELQQEVCALQSTNAGFMNQIQQLRQDLKKKSAAIEESKECIEVLREERRCALETQEQLQCEADERLDQIRALRVETQELGQRVRDQENTITQANECIERHISSISEERVKAEAERQMEVKQYVEEQGVLLKENQTLQHRVESMQEQLEMIVELKDNFAFKIQTLEQEVTELSAAKINAEEAQAQALLRLQQLESVQRELAEARKREAESLAALATLKEETSTATSIAEKHRSELNSIMQQKDEAEKALAATQEQMQLLEAENLRIQDSERRTRDALTELELHHESCEELQSLVSTLSDHLSSSDDEKREWKKKCAVLEKLVEPFREQLENYEAERNNLLSSKTAAQKEVEDLSMKYASLLGHQNHKQKIQHVVKLKENNLKLQEEVFKLRSDNDKQRKAIRRLEERLGDSDHRKTLAGVSVPQMASKSNKENVEVVARSPLRPSNKLERL